MTEFEKLPGIGGKRLTECGKILFVFRQGRETGSTVSDLQISIGLCAEIDDLLPGKRLQGIFSPGTFLSGAAARLLSRWAE